MPENRNKTDQQKAGPSTPSSEPQRKSLGEIDKAEKAALKYGFGALKKFSPKRKPGFAKLPEKSEEEKALEGMSSQEKMELLKQVLEAKPETPHQRFLSQKLSVLQNVVQRLTTKTSLEISEMLGNFNVRKKLREKYRDRFRNPKLPQPSEEARFLKEEFDKLKKWFEENAQALAMRTLAEPHFSIEQTLPEEIREIIESYGISLKELKTEKDVYDYYARYILELRKKKDYEAATNLAEELLANEFSEAQKSFQKEQPDVWQKQLEEIKSEILLNGKTVQLYRELKGQWKAQGMTEDQINEYYGTMQKMELARGVRKFFAKHYLDGKIAIPESKSSVWAQYRYMLDPKDETFLLEDESWDEITSELMINAPLIIVSGGFAALGRGAIAAGALELSGATARFLASRGVELSARRYLTGSLVSQAIKTTAKAGVNLALEGAIFDTTHRALTFQHYESLPDWAKSTFWSAVTLGAFHGSGRFAERTFAKQTALGKAVAKIKNPHVQEAAKTLLLKGHIEAATMLLTGAIQNAEYTGSLDQFFHDFGDELLHAYVSIGALKISSAIAQPSLAAINAEIKADKMRDAIENASRDAGKSTVKHSAKEVESGTVNAEKDLRTIRDEYDDLIKALPKEAPGPNEALRILRRARQSLSVEEKALADNERNAIVRARFYRILSELSRTTGEIMDRVLEYARDNLTATREELLDQAIKHGFDKLPAEVRKKMQIAFLRFERNRRIMKTVAEKFAPSELFEKIFGFKPFNPISISEEPFCLSFIIDPIDYLRIDRPDLAHASREIIEKTLVDSPPESGGAILPALGKKLQLEGLITIAKDRQSSNFLSGVIRHEERHSMHNAFFSLAGKFGKLNIQSEQAHEALREFSLQSNNIENFGERNKYVIREAPRILNEFRKAFLEKAHDEIVAYLEQGREIPEIRLVLLKRGGAGYDYPGQEKTLVLESFPFGTKGMADTLYDRMTSQYFRDVARAIFIAGNLTAGAKTYAERSAMLAELSTTPIERWEKIFGDRVRQTEQPTKTDELMILRDEWNDFVQKEQKRNRSNPSRRDILRYMRFFNNRSQRTVHQHDWSDLMSSSGFKDILRDSLKHNIELANREPTKENANNVFKDTNTILDESPPQLMEYFVETIILPLINHIKDPRLKSLCRGAVYSARSLELRQAPGAFRMPDSTKQESGRKTRPDRMAATVAESGLPNLTREGLRENARIILARVADKIIKLRDQFKAEGKSHFPDFLEALDQKTHRLRIPLTPDHPVLQNLAGKIRDTAVKHGWRFLDTSGNPQFSSPLFKPGRTPRKVYITPPIERISEFLDAFMAVVAEHNISLTGKIHLDAIRKDATDQNLMPIYFENDAQFQQFLKILPEIEKRAGANLDAYSTAELPMYGHAYGGKVRFSFDKEGEQGSYDQWSGQVFGAGAQEALLRGGTRDKVILAMVKQLKKIRPELQDLSDFLAIIP